MTDVRQTTATLVLGEDLDGRFFIRNAAQELVVELYKPRGRKVELGVEPGDLRSARSSATKTSLLAKTRVDDGATRDARARSSSARSPSRRRAGAAAARPRPTRTRSPAATGSR